MAPRSRILAWRIPWTEEPCGLQSWGREELDTTEHQHEDTAEVSQGQGQGQGNRASAEDILTLCPGDTPSDDCGRPVLGGGECPGTWHTRPLQGRGAQDRQSSHEWALRGHPGGRQTAAGARRVHGGCS